MLTQLRAPEGKMRRRRTEQPVYASRRRRRLVIGLTLGITTLALAGYYGFRLFQRIRLEGETFRETLNRRVSDAVGCQIELTRIHDGGEDSLSATEARFDTMDQELFESGQFSDLNASLTSSSWVSNEWGIKQLTINQGTIRLNPERPVFPNDAVRRVPVTARRERDGGGFRFGISPDPDIITLDLIRTRNLTLEWPAGGPGPKPESIRGLVGHAKFARGGGIEGAFTAGTIALNLLPELRLEHLQWKLTGRRLEIPGARIVFGGDARAEITGNADLVSDGGVNLDVNFVGTPLKSLLPPVWHERVLGKFAASGATFHATFGKGPERVLEGEFTVTGAVLRGIGFVNKIADALQRPDFAFLEFPELTGHFKWSPSAGLEITSLSASDKETVIRLAGNVTVTADDRVSGQLKASVSDTLLRNRTRTDLPHPFGPPSDGWASVNLTLSGTGAALNDNLVIQGPPDNSPAPNVTPDAPPTRGPAPAPVRTPAVAPAPRPAPRASKEDLEKDFNDLLPK